MTLEEKRVRWLQKIVDEVRVRALLPELLGQMDREIAAEAAAIAAEKSAAFLADQTYQLHDLDNTILWFKECIPKFDTQFLEQLHAQVKAGKLMTEAQQGALDNIKAKFHVDE